MVLGGIVSVQFGGALAAKLIETLGAPGTVALRLAMAVPILLLIARPSLRNRSRRDLLAVVAFGIVLGDDVVAAVLLTRVVDRQDVGML